MLVIRLQRIGKKHQPSYRVTVAERRSKVGAPPAEFLGLYNPSTKIVVMNGERVQYWMKKGAQPSATVWNLLVREKVVEGKARPIKTSKKKTKEGAPIVAVVGKTPEAKPAT